MSENKLKGDCKTCSTYSDDIKIKFDKTVMNLHMNNCKHVYSMGEVKLENAPIGEDGELRVKVGFNSYHETDK